MTVMSATQAWQHIGKKALVSTATGMPLLSKQLAGSKDSRSHQDGGAKMRGTYTQHTPRPSVFPKYLRSRANNSFACFTAGSSQYFV